MELHIATKADIPKILPLIIDFISESGWKLKYNGKNSREFLERYIDSDECDVLFIEDGAPIGFAIVAFDNEFHDERFGYVTKFFIAKEARGTVSGRMLAECMCRWFDHHGCTDTFATSTAMIGEDRLFINLMGKYGFRECGATLVRSRK